jgi:hypothetical protein
MSRPKKRAYHFLHKSFSDLDHSRSSISDFLWKAYAQQGAKSEKTALQPRMQKPGPNFIPWRRSSGQLIAAMIDGVINYQGRVSKEMSMPAKIDSQYSVTVGDPKHCVDLMMVSDDSRKGNCKSVAVIDLCGFEPDENCASNVIDYYFQLQRATPAIQPVFMFVHELADQKSRSYQRFLRSLVELAVVRKEKKDPKAKKKAS